MDEDIDSAVEFLATHSFPSHAEKARAVIVLLEELRQGRSQLKALRADPKPELPGWWDLKRHAVSGSSNVRAARYSAKERRLEIAYRNGGVYAYKDVPPRVYSDFLESQSKGRFLNQKIKPNYSCERVRK